MATFHPLSPLTGEDGWLVNALATNVGHSATATASWGSGEKQLLPMIGRIFHRAGITPYTRSRAPVGQHKNQSRQVPSRTAHDRTQNTEDVRERRRAREHLERARERTPTRRSIRSVLVGGRMCGCFVGVWGERDVVFYSDPLHRRKRDASKTEHNSPFGEAHVCRE